MRICCLTVALSLPTCSLADDDAEAHAKRAYELAAKEARSLSLQQDSRQLILKSANKVLSGAPEIVLRHDDDLDANPLDDLLVRLEYVAFENNARPPDTAIDHQEHFRRVEVNDRVIEQLESLHKLKPALRTPKNL